MAVHSSVNNTVSVQTSFPEGMGGARYDPDRHGYRIYVGNLPHDTGHDDLARLFLTFGPIVDIWLASNPPGFGFVVFKNAADAETAVLGKNCTVFRGMIMKVQHARMFKDRFIKPFHKGRRSATGSDTSKSRSRSRSLSRSSRSRSRSSSRLRHISKIYGSSRARSRSPLREGSKSRSRSRSRSSPLTSMSDSSSCSRSRSVPRHGYSSSEGRDGKCSSSNNRHNRCHRRHRSSRHRSSLGGKSHSSLVTEKARYSSTRSHSASSSSTQCSRSSSRSHISSAHEDKRQHHHHHRHTRPSSSPEDSASSQSPSSANDSKDSPAKITGKSRRQRKRKRSHRPKRDSSSSSSFLSSASSSSSSSSSSSPVPGRRRKKGGAGAETQNLLSRKPRSALVQEDDLEPDLPVTANHPISTAMSPANSISPLLPSASPPVIFPAHTSLSNSIIPHTQSAFSTFGTCHETPAVVDPVTRTVDLSVRTASVQKPAANMSSLSSLSTCQTCALPEEEDALCEISLSCESVFPSVGNVSVTTSTVAPYRAVLQNSSSRNSAATCPKLTMESDCVGTINHPISTSTSVLDAPTFRSSMPTFSGNDLSSRHSPGTSQASDHTVTRLITSIAVRHPSSSIAISECLSVMAAALNVPDTTSVQLKTTSTTTSADRLVSTAPTLTSRLQDEQCGCHYHTKYAARACGSVSADSEGTAGKEGSGAPCDDDGSGRHSVSSSTMKMTAGGALLQHFDLYPGTSSGSVKDVAKENPIDNSTKHTELQELERQPCSLRASRPVPLWATDKKQDDLVNISENRVELTKNCTRKLPITGYDFVNDDAMMEKEIPDIPTLSDSGSGSKQSGLEQQNTKMPETTLAAKNGREENSPKAIGNHTPGKLPAGFTGFSIENRKTADMKQIRAVPEKQDNPRFIPRQNDEQNQHSAKQVSENNKMSDKVSEDNKMSDKDTFFTDPWNSPPSQVPKSCTRSYQETTHQPGLWEAANMDEYSDQVTPGFHSSHQTYERNSLHNANRPQKMHIKLHSTVLPSANDRPQPGARETDRQTTDPDFQFRKGEMDDPIQRQAPYYISTMHTSPTRHSLPDNATPTCSCIENRRSARRIKHQHFAHTSGANHRHRNYRHSSDLRSEETVFDPHTSRWTPASYAKDITFVENHRRRRWSDESSDSSTESRERSDSRTKVESKSQDQLRKGFRPAKTVDRNYNSRNGS